jgi:hypothetical protein
LSAHDCVFPEVEILTDDEDENLKTGMRVLTPCRDCGETPLDHMQLLESYVDEYGRALTQARPIMPLFHWSPIARRKQIIRYGLRPFMRTTTSISDDEWRHPVVCFADSPSWAWALSGGMSWTPAGEWDLWQTDLGRLTDPVVLPGEDRMSGIYEVRTLHRVYKRDLWHVGTRVKLTAETAT